MKIRIIVVGKIKENFYISAIKEYQKRLTAYSKVEIIEVADEKTKEDASDIEKELIRKKEGERLLQKVSDNDYVITLEISGNSLNSEELAEFVNRRMIEGKSSIVFIIGGSLGLAKEVCKRADYSLSFSKFTFPHQLMRVILLEQIYRTFKIIKNEPYHK